MILLNAETNTNVFIDSGRGNNRKLLCINATTPTIGHKKAIAGLCAFASTNHNSFNKVNEMLEYRSILSFHFPQLGN